ncbi:MAG: hypothetical protein O2924_04165 [Chloroflexi bacterium]|nr:hypothetical protein [Chloroflexota bacterium]MQC47513.1 hypothetical protein [Chloroflexota bacterium]
MRVEFNVDECHRMVEAVMDQLYELDLDKKDRANLRRWSTDEMGPGDPLMQRLEENISSQVQRNHDRSEVSQIKKPDWL